MKSAKFLVLFATLCALASTGHAQVKVEIFYETLNDVVRRFFVEQYYQASSNNLLSEASVDLRLYPYGNTKKDGNVYTCPYGDIQCEANRVHACLVRAEILTPENPDSPPTNPDNKINQTSASNFVNCFFKNRYADEEVESLGERCSSTLGVETDWAEIRACIIEPESDAFVDAIGALTTDATVAAAITDGFAVRIGGTINAAAKTNFVGEVCKATSQTADICTQTAAPAKVKIAIYYEADSTDASNFLVNQLFTWYHVLEDFVDVELIPYGNTKYDATNGYNCSTDQQCISNKYQALVVDAYKAKNGDPISGPNRAINFIACVFQSTAGSALTALEQCSNQKLEADDYRTFITYIKVNSKEVTDVFDSMRTKTQAIIDANGGVLPRVPTVTVNGQVDFSAFQDLVQEACAQYTSPVKASICTKTNVTVFYEALNHKSRTLFLEQLKPVFNNLNNLVTLNMIPAGRAVVAPGHGFVCPGGNDQCVAMKLQACAIDFFWNDGNNYTDPIRQEIFEFVVCTFKNKKLQNVMDAANDCADQYIEADAWFTIHGCLLDGTADAILGEYIEETQSSIENVAQRSVPIVQINGVEVTDLTSIKAQICGLYDDYHQPDYCQSDLPTKVQVKVYYESMSELSKYFFTKQFNPWYIYIEEMASVQLLPAGNVRETVTQDGTCDSYDANSTCLANKIQAFVIDKYSNHDDDGDFIDGTLRTMSFLGCFFDHPNWKDNVYGAAEFCTEEKLLDDEWFDLLTTVKSEVGNGIYKTVVDATKQFIADNNLETLEPVPWVTLDNKNHSKRAADDLLKTVCDQYPGLKPLECTRVQVEVYYSAINPQSRRFFVDQLIPVFRNLRERIDLDLIPFGVANPDLTLEQECANKDKVCLANKAQACAIDKFFKDEVIDSSIQWDGKNQTLAFVYCMFKNIKNLDIAQLAEECANNNIILADEITECAAQSEGTELLSGMRNRTLGQYETMDHAPWIVINGLRVALAESDLKTAVCNAMVGDKPDFCYNPTPAKVKVQFHYSAADQKVADYVISELYPNYRGLEEIFDLDVVPFGQTEVLSQDDGNYTLICPNGEEECRANLIHACVYGEYFNNDEDPASDNQDEYDGRLQVIEFIGCYFKSAEYQQGKWVDAAEECVEQTFGDIYSSIKECAQSSVGRNLLLDFQKKVDALLPHLSYVPWITLNGKHNYAVEHHIERSVCDAYTGLEKPGACYDPTIVDPVPVVALHYEIGDTGSKDFFAKLIPDHISEIANIQLVPFGRSTYTDATKKCVNNDDCSQYKEHACIANLFLQTDPVRTLKTIACTFGDLMNDPTVVNECADQNLDNIPDVWRQIETCVLENGDRLMQENAALASALAPAISHVPWVLINEEHDIEAEVSLVNELCGLYYPADKPTLCKPDLLPVKVYYETKNTNVGSFFLNQVSQFTEYLDEIAQFDFYPYGSTTSSGTGFTCPAGELQCVANKVHACVLNRYYNRSSVNPDDQYELNRIRTVGFLECAFFEDENGKPDPVQNAEECLDRNFEGDLWRDIHFCFAGPEGDDLMKEMGRQTAALSPALTSAPVVTIAGQQSANALKNLFQTLCDSYGNVRAPLCAALPSLAVKVGIYFSGNAASQTYFNTQVLPFYKEIVPALRDGTDEAKLHSIISPDLTAWGKTTYDASNTDKPFTCEGGDSECYINRFFACANNKHGAEPRATLHLVELALCFFGNDQALTNPASVFNNCTNRIWIPDPYIELDICATEKSQAAYDIFLKAKAKTENNYPALTSFPAVTINNRRDEHAEQNLLASACYHYQGTSPPAVCADQPTQTPTGTTPTGTTPTGTTPTGTTPTGTTPGGDVPTTTTTAPPTTTTTQSPIDTTTPGAASTCTLSIVVLFASFFLSRFFF